MSVSVPVDAERLAHLDLGGQLLADLAPQPFRQALARLQLAAGEFPHAAQQTAGRSLGHQHLPISVDHRSRHLVMRDGRASLFDRALLLDAQSARRAQVFQRAVGAIGRARRADARAQVHQRLVVIAGASRRKMLFGQRPQCALALRRARRNAQIEHARKHPADVAVHQRGFVLPKGNRGDCPGRVTADTRQAL